MKKVLFHDKEQVSLADLQAISQLVQNNGLAQLVQHLLIGADKVLSGGAVTASSPAAMTVEVAACVGYHHGVPVIGDTTSATITPADPALGRIDVVAIGRVDADSTAVTRTFWDPVTEAEYNQSVYIRQHDGFEVIVVAGTPAASPAAPTTYNGVPITDNYLILAEVAVDAAATAINSDDITDKRQRFAFTSGYLRWFKAGPVAVEFLDGDGWPVPEDCVALALFVYEETKCTAVSPGDYFYVAKNGVASDLTLYINTGSDNPESVKGWVEFAEGDRLSVGTATSSGTGEDAHVAVLLGKKPPAVNLD